MARHPRYLVGSELPEAQRERARALEKYLLEIRTALYNGNRADAERIINSMLKTLSRIT